MQPSRGGRGSDPPSNPLGGAGGVRVPHPPPGSKGPIALSSTLSHHSHSRVAVASRGPERAHPRPFLFAGWWLPAVCVHRVAGPCYTRKVWWRNGRGSEPERLKLKSKVDLSSSVESGHLSWRDRGARSKTVCRRARAKFGVLIQNGTCSFEFDAMNAEIRLDLLKDGRAQLHRTRLATHHS